MNDAPTALAVGAFCCVVVASWAVRLSITCHIAGEKTVQLAMPQSSADNKSTHLFWYCQSCRKSCKVQPPTEEPACRCKQPVPGLHPTQVTIASTPKPRRMHALDDEEARIRALARKGTKVRITFEATVADAIQWSAADRRGLEFDLTTSDGRHYSIDPQLPGLHIEAADEGDT